MVELVFVVVHLMVGCVLVVVLLMGEPGLQGM